MTKIIIKKKTLYKCRDLVYVWKKCFNIPQLILSNNNTKSMKQINKLKGVEIYEWCLTPPNFKLLNTFSVVFHHTFYLCSIKLKSKLNTVFIINTTDLENNWKVIYK